MIKEILVAGIKLNNYNVLEMLTQIAKNLETNVFTTVEDIYMKTVLLAKEDESVKEVLESLDVTAIAEVGVLDAVGQATILRRKEIERREFFFQFMKILERNGHTVYILGQDEKEVEETIGYISKNFSRMKIVGSTVLTGIDGVEDSVVNEINMLAPDVILSVLPSPLQEKFLKRHKPMMLTKIWYGVGAGHISGSRLTFATKILKFLRKYTLKKYVQEDIQNEEMIEIDIEENVESRE